MTATPVTSPGEGRFATARKVADAVIYEGYVLYPYRASAQKNQVRWQFGVLAPRPFSEATDPSPGRCRPSACSRRRARRP